MFILRRGKGSKVYELVVPSIPAAVDVQLSSSGIRFTDVVILVVLIVGLLVVLFHQYKAYKATKAKHDEIAAERHKRGSRLLQLIPGVGDGTLPLPVPVELAARLYEEGVPVVRSESIAPLGDVTKMQCELPKQASKRKAADKKAVKKSPASTKPGKKKVVRKSGKAKRI